MEGTFALTEKWLGSWPVPTTTPMFTNPIPGGLLHADAIPNGTIEFRIIGDDGQTATITSVPIAMKSKVIKLAVAWKLPGDISVFANGVHIASLLPANLPASACLPTVSRRGTAIDFASANDLARKKRADEERSRIARPGLRLRTLDEEVDFLHAATLQLKELTGAIQKGMDYHFHATIALVRSLIARGGRNFQPLTQRVSGRLDRPLLLYAPLFSGDSISAISGLEPSFSYRFDVLHEREVGDEAEIDLDVWLETTAISKMMGKTVTQNEVIRLFSDAAGSHFDPDTSEDFDALEAITVYPQGEPCSMMAVYTAQIAMCICHLNEALILFARP